MGARERLMAALGRPRTPDTHLRSGSSAFTLTRGGEPIKLAIDGELAVLPAGVPTGPRQGEAPLDFLGISPAERLVLRLELRYPGNPARRIGSSSFSTRCEVVPVVDPEDEGKVIGHQWSFSLRDHGFVQNSDKTVAQPPTLLGSEVSFHNNNGKELSITGPGWRIDYAPESN